MSASLTLPLPQDLQERLDRIGLEFLADFLGRASSRHPDQLETLAELATTLTRLGRLEEGLAADERLVRLVPEDPTVHYNLACSLALLGRKETALDALERALDLGYRDADHLANDQDLDALRGEARFVELVERLESAE